MKHRTACFVTALLLSAGLLSAQGTTSRLLGTVADPSGAVVVGAKVQLANEGTGVAFNSTTSQAGTYLFDSIQSGSYTVTVEAAGFKKFAAKGNVVTIGQPTTVNVTLQVGALTEQVEVAGAYEAVQTSTSGNIGNLFSEQIIKDLPIVGTRGRNPLNLVILQAGVNDGANTGGGYHVNGARDRAWNFTLDGIDTNETSAGGSNFSPLRTNPDSLAEFRVITSNFTADAGRNSGGQVAMITRSGTNDFHGSGFWFYRSPSLNASEWQANFNRLSKPQFIQHIYGGSVGGPVTIPKVYDGKNKTFFFVNVQRLAASNRSQVTRTVYTQQARQGILRYVRGSRNFPAGSATASVDFNGNPIPGLNIGTYNVITSDPQRLGLDKTIQPLYTDAPLPNRFDTGDGLNTAGFTFQASQLERQQDVTFKIDQTINSQHTLYARIAFGYQNTNCDSANGGEPIFPGQPCFVNTTRDPKNYAFNWRATPTAHFTNEFVFGMNQFAFDFVSPMASLEKPSLYGPVATVADYNVGNKRDLRTLQFVDNASWFQGAHAVKFGTNLRFQRHLDVRGSVAGMNANRVVNFSTNVNTVDPATFGLPSDLNQAFDLPNFQTHINWMLGRVGRQYQAFVAQGDQFVPGVYNYSSRYPEYDFYVQDTWKLRRNLTIDLGLRWEIKMSPSNSDNRVRHPDHVLATGAPPTNTAKWVTGPLYRDSIGNLGPSVGFAWDPRGNGKTSIRSNYRIAYDRINTFAFSSAVFQNLPGIAQGVSDESYGQGGGRLAGLAALKPPAAKPSDLAQPAPFSVNPITVLDPNFQMPTTHQWSFSIQRQVFDKYVLQADYIGRRAHNLFGAYNANQVEIFKNGFLSGFNTIKAGGQSAVINRAVSADTRIRAGETASEMIRRLFPSQLQQDSVAAVAASLATRIQGDRNVTALSIGDPYFFIPFTQHSTTNVIDSNDFSTYHALQLQIERRMSQGLAFNVNYTWSKSLDTRSFDPAFTVVGTGAGQSASSTPMDVNNRRGNYARSDFDRTHQLKTNFIYELPFGRGRRWGSGANAFLERVIGGWQLTGVFVLYTGRPFTVFSGTNSFGNIENSYADCNGCPRDLGKVFDDVATGYKWYFDPTERAKFALPAAGSIGSAGRNTFTGDAYFDIDAVFLKRTRITEQVNLEVRADVTNITNTPSFGFPTTTYTSTLFGRIGATLASGARKFQLGTKINF